jgi:hypothetical protein
VQLIARPRDVGAFVAAARGFKLMREESYEAAHRQLCSASALLGVIASRNLTGRTRDEIAALRRFVLESAGRAVTKRRAAGSGGALALQDDSQPCAERLP